MLTVTLTIFVPPCSRLIPPTFTLVPSCPLLGDTFWMTPRAKYLKELANAALC